ncbi:MAG TPA: hypothetical protein VH639_17540 [Bryobacteraceae bacterium]|jgi:hypothetical protein
MSASVLPAPGLTGSAPSQRNAATPVIAAAGVLLLALALAAGIQLVQAGRPAERAVMLTGVFLAAILAAAPGAYLLVRGLRAQPGTLGLCLLTSCAVCSLGIYFFWVSSYVFFPADILIWSEGDFINDILKFSIGYPIYAPQFNNDSINYVPGAQLLTHLLGSIIGKAWSIPTYRMIQLGYAAAAAFLGVLSCRRILRLAFPQSRFGEALLWNCFCFAMLMLAATNSITNHFAHNLHADSLAEAANVGAFYLLLRYIESRSRGVLWAMAAMVTAGFFVRQNALIWGVCYVAFLAIWGGSWKRLALFTAGTAAIYGAAIAACFALWGQPFYYWVFYMLSKHAVAPLRSFQHAMDAWAYFAAILLGGAATLRGRNSSPLFGAWLACLLVFLSETYTSGIGWMLNHMGPGSLLAVLWALAGLISVWNLALASTQTVERTVECWIRAGALTATVALMFSGLGFIRIPLKPIPPDAYRYIHDIEAQFQGLPAKQVLLDLGTWPYIKEKAIVGDRATSIGDRGYSGAGDFTGILTRISEKHYSKILVHGYHSFDFVYDYFLFPKPTGIRQALLDNYRETGTIRAVEGNPYVKDWAEDPFYFGEISILEPKK